MGYEVEIAELRAKGQEVRRLGHRTRKVEYGAALTGMKGALPGSESDRQIAPLSNAWDTRVGDLGTAVADHGDRMERAADRYQRDEQQAEDELTELEPR